MRITYVFLLCQLLLTPLLAQQSKVEDYVKEVYDYSLTIKSASETSSAAQYALKQAQRNFYPRLDAALSATYALKEYSFMPGISLEPFNGYVGLTLSQNVYSGSLVRNSAALADVASQMAEYSELLVAENVILAASSMYWMLVAANAYVDVATQYLDLIASNYDLLKIKFEEGVLSKNDLLMMLTRKKQAEYGLVQAQKNQEKLLSNFNILRGKASSDSVNLGDSIMIVDASLPVRVASSDILEQNSEFNINKLNIQKSINQMKINAASYLPQISLGISGTYGTQTFNIDGSIVWDGQVYFKASAPIFAWGQKRQKRLSDMALVRLAKYELENTTDNISKNISDSYIALAENFEQLSVTNSSLEIANESLDLSIFSFDEGVVSVLELLSAQLSWLSAYNSKIAANMSYRI